MFIITLLPSCWFFVAIKKLLKCWVCRSQNPAWKQATLLICQVLWASTTKSNVNKAKFSLKYGLHNKSFILNAPLVSCPIPVICFGWVCCCTHPKQMTGIGQSVLKQFYIEIDNYWKWATDQRCIQNKWLVMKSIL